MDHLETAAEFHARAAEQLHQLPADLAASLAEAGIASRRLPEGVGAALVGDGQESR